MTLHVVIRSTAQTESVEAAAWYEQERDGLGEEFVREVEVAVGNAAISPALYGTVSGDAVGL
jgi:hypothetical protein